jgi:hypothetical protein
MSLVGKKVLVEFNTATWPIHKATYTYEGRDETGYWLRRQDGVQRFFERGDIVSITPVEEGEEDVPEQPY